MSDTSGRSGLCQRETAETRIRVQIELDRSEPVRIHTGIPFFDHMLNQIARHGRFGLVLEADGDLEVDCHHTVEDCGLALGAALDQALGERRGIARYATAYVPMDEALARVVLDLSGRPYLHANLPLDVERIGSFETQTLVEFLRALTVTGRLTLHADFLHGVNAHHLVEALFKALGRALRDAVRLEGDWLPSTKGVL
ncbi:MAG: imidazoleglycerol-phosphate dehydratase HisB [Bacillota bacterium]|nr:imidazoleglycerol-phosphate dehydratase HisB [Bacillota bacterium]